jgi:hypothetical protein
MALESSSKKNIRVKQRQFSLHSVIALSYEGKYYGTRRGDFHRGCCDTVPIKTSTIHFASEKHLLTIRCSKCGFELTSIQEQITIDA